ncbi:MAG TPA: sugar ABC transporter permease [Thermomicrobiales bacterium]
MVGWYTLTLVDYAIAGTAIIVSMVVLNKVLRWLGVNREAATGYALILPWLLGFLIWNLGPFIASFYFSLTEYGPLRSPRFIGLDNYVRMFRDDPNFWPVIRFTFLYSLFNVPLGLLGALFTATLLNQNVRGLGFWRTVYYLPAVLPAAATALLWRWLFARSGLINFILRPIYNLLDIEAPSWFTEPRLILPGYIIMGMWGVFGANTIILLAGLKNIPRDLYEAAILDGAGRVKRYLTITLPMLSPSLFYVLIMGIIGSFQAFTVAFFVDHSRRVGTFINVYIYEQAFGRLNGMGYAAALGWVALVIILLFTLLVFKSSPAWVYYEGERAG